MTLVIRLIVYYFIFYDTESAFVLLQEINEFRMHLATLFVYDMISMPLVYTQVSVSFSE